MRGGEGRREGGFRKESRLVSNPYVACAPLSLLRWITLLSLLKRWAKDDSRPCSHYDDDGGNWVDTHNGISDTPALLDLRCLSPSLTVCRLSIFFDLSSSSSVVSLRVSQSVNSSRALCLHNSSRFESARAENRYPRENPQDYGRDIQIDREVNVLCIGGRRSIRSRD